MFWDDSIPMIALCATELIPGRGARQVERSVQWRRLPNRLAVLKRLLVWSKTSRSRGSRPRRAGRKFVRRTGIAYTPGPTRHAEAAIRDLLIARGARLFPRDVPLSVRSASTSRGRARRRGAS